jgi:Na+-driven multidrug efflux pump
MAGTWLMMSLEPPFLAAIIARLAEPKENLAAFGVSFAVAVLVESPIIMILSASTALVQGPVSYRRLRNFTYGINGVLTFAMIAMLATPLWRWLASDLLRLPPDVAGLTQGALWILVPWPAAIGYRRFYQGLLIRQGRTRLVAYGTLIRMVSVTASVSLLFLLSSIPGALIGAWGLTLGVSAEAIASRFMARNAVRDSKAGEADMISYRRIVRFYWPLAMTSVIGLAAHPVVTFFMGYARFPLESLAVLPVVNSLSFIFRAVGISYQEVAIAVLARDPGSHPVVARFAAWLSGLSALAMALIVFTPLSTVWFRTISGLSAELTAFALTPARILVLLPALSVMLSLQRAILVHGRNTAPITWATALEIGGIVAALWFGTAGMDLVGATAAAIAFIAGRLLCNAALIRPSRSAVKRIIL